MNASSQETPQTELAISLAVESPKNNEKRKEQYASHHQILDWFLKYWPIGLVNNAYIDFFFLLHLGRVVFFCFEEFCECAQKTYIPNYNVRMREKKQNTESFSI